MYTAAYLVVASLAAIEVLAAAVPRVTPNVTPRALQRFPTTRRDLPVLTVQRELGPLLSNLSTIIGPDSPNWDNATDRFNIYTRPDVEVVVFPGEEKDVSTIVAYCNDNSIEFLAYGRGHGFTTTLKAFKGLQINMGQLAEINVSEDEESVFVQGGLDNGQVQEALWTQGFVTVTGTATCVGLMGAGLGGGHGVYEGQYGLVEDNFLHMNVVLANGTVIGVNESSHQDLFWGMRGAGHNFGIVTSAKMKIYPRKIDTWHYHNYWWTGDKLEAVLEAINDLPKPGDNGSSPPLLGFNAGQYAMNASVSTTEATLFWSFAYAGPASDAEEILAPFNAIEAVDHVSGDTPFPNLSNAVTATGEGGSCVPNRFVGASTVAGAFNITAQRKLYDLYSRKAVLYPELAQYSQIYNEGYSTKAVDQIPGDSTAYPHRGKKHIIFILFALDADSDFQDVALEWSKETWDIWLEGEGEGAKPTTYVNYALNNPWETQNSIYGDESWRLEKLKTLKRNYDPFNQFRYFVPIVSGGNGTSGNY